MKLKLLALLSASFVYGNSDVNITSNQWQFLGVQQDVNLSTLNLQNNDTIWSYKNNSWSCFQKSVDLSEICYQVDTLDSGDGFWLLSDTSYNLSLPENNTIIKEKDLYKGWNMVTPIVNSIDTNDMFSYKDINSIWSYNDNNWSLWTPFQKDTNYSKITKIDKNQGFWIYSNINNIGSNIYKDINNYDYNSFVSFGNDKGGLKDGNFSTVTKLSTSDIEDIWNIRFKIDDNITDTFNIGFRIVKENGSYANVVYDNLKIDNKDISTPSIIYIDAQSSSGSQKTSSDHLTNLKAILKDSISLKNGILSLNFGTIIKADISDQLTVDSFKTKANYDIKISSDKLNFLDSKIDSIGTLITEPKDINYSNTSTLKGSIVIK